MKYRFVRLLLPLLSFVASPIASAQSPVTVPDVSARFHLDGHPTPDTSDDIARRDRIRVCLARYAQRSGKMAERTPWEALHHAIAFGVDSRISEKNTIAWLARNGTYGGRHLLQLASRDGSLQVGIGPGLQGHKAQFLSVLAQANVPDDFAIQCEGTAFTIRDLVQSEQQRCLETDLHSFQLIGLSHYLDSDENWHSAEGGVWSVERLVREELEQPIIGGACGGTHRLMAISFAIRARSLEHRPLSGQWKRANQFIKDFQEYTFSLQNADGSFSTNYFESRSEWGSLSRRLTSTGHITEWLAYSLSQQQLTEDRMHRAIDYLTTLLLENDFYSWDFGPTCHALHALALYDERVFHSMPGRREFLTIHDIP